MRADMTILALDIGSKRIGVARANIIALLPEALVVLKNDESFIEELKRLIELHKAVILVVGLPRGLGGQETTQTKYTKQFVDSLEKSINIPIVLEDEALSSLRAKDRLKSGKAKMTDIDAQAAAEILNNYIDSNRSNIDKIYEKK